MAFQKFSNIKQGVNPAVSVNCDNGYFRFNRAAFREFKLAQWKYCWLYYDKDEKRIGFEFSDTPENGQCKVQNKRYTYGVAGLSFINHFNIAGLIPKNTPMKLERDRTSFFHISLEE